MTVTINGTTGLAGVDGSAGTPAVQGGDTNTGIFFPAADTVGVATGGSERMRIDSSGNVGIGTSSPVSKLTVAGSSAVLSLIDTDRTVNTYGAVWADQAGNVFLNADYDGTAGGAFISFRSNGSSAGSEKMRIDSSGIVLVGATSARTTQAKIELTSAANTALSFYMYKTSQAEMAMGFKSSTDTNFYIGSGSTSVGTNGVYLTNTGSSWNAVSDERMKTILEPIENASEKVSSLRAVIGYYNNDESQIRRPFLIAQDVQKVLPEAVNVQDQETGTLGMSYTDTIPLLVAAIKEQQALITALTDRITALEAK